MNLLGLGFTSFLGFRVGVESPHLAFARHGERKPVIGEIIGWGIDFDLARAVLDGDREFHALVRSSRRILCKLCANIQRPIDFIGKSGCPTWIRTMTKASKELCATITPSDNGLIK